MVRRSGKGDNIVVSDAERHSAFRARNLSGMLRLVFLTPGFQLALSIRAQKLLGKIPLVGKMLRRVLWYWTTIYFSCDIDPYATFGPGIYFPHPTGIVIGGEWDFGAGVTIQQGVTVGRVRAPTRRSRVGDNVLIGAGAKILGEFDIGANARIGANAVVLFEVPAGVTAVGVPAKVLDGLPMVNQI